MCKAHFKPPKNAITMRIRQTGEIVEILCGEIGRTGASTPTPPAESQQQRVDVGIDPYEPHKVENAPNFIRQIFNGR